MADVDWQKYDCSICLAVTLGAAAVGTSLAAAVFGALGLPVVLQVILFVVTWVILGKIAEKFCAVRQDGTASNANAVVRPSSSDADETKTKNVSVAADSESITTNENALDAASVASARDPKSRIEEPVDEAAEEHETPSEANAKSTEPPKSLKVELDHDRDGPIEGFDDEKRPEALDAPRNGTADDLKRIKGIGPKLEQLCNRLGFYHFDQIAGWSANEVAWVDSNLEGFKGRVSRDGWVEQAILLAKGDETDFSKRVDGGDVPSSK